ncbi:MAG: hypothetical protein AAB473_00810 [Patescibacteria group bacterium]
MFAKAYPILRLPRRFTVFDYAIPEGTSVSVGDVIQIPFRHRTVLGVVKSITESTSEKRVLDITSGSIGFTIPEIDLARIETIASELGQSISSILNVAYEGLNPYPPSKDFPSRRNNENIGHSKASPKIDLETIASVHTVIDRLKTDRTIALACDDETFCVLAHAICKTTTNQVVILAPRERDARLIAGMLSQFVPSILTGKIPPRDRNRILRSWRNGDTRILVGTRQSVLAAAQSLGAVLVYQSGCEDHGSPLRNPHIDSVRVAEALAQSANSIFVSADVFPTPSATLPLLVTNDGTDPALVDVVHKGENSPYPLMSQTLLESIKLALQSQKRVLLSFNRKGVAKRMECKACGHVPFCGTCGSLPMVRLDDLLCTACGTEMWRPTTCPACGSPKIGLKSIGGAKIADDLHKAFPEATIGHIQKGRIDHNANIILATEFFFSSVIEPFATYNFGVVAEILGDLSFTPGDYRGAEITARKIARLRHLAYREHAECIIQTLTRDRLQSLLGAEYVNRVELEARKKYSLPPFGIVVEFEGETKETLPIEIGNRILVRDDATHRLYAKIDHETFIIWQKLFPTIPDSIKIRVSE